MRQLRGHMNLNLTTCTYNLGRANDLRGARVCRKIRPSSAQASVSCLHKRKFGVLAPRLPIQAGRSGT